MSNGKPNDTWGGAELTLNWRQFKALLKWSIEQKEPDKPKVVFGSPADPDQVSSAFTIRVQDCKRTYEELKSRGAQFLTPPRASDSGGEIRCFFRDPAGHLFEISQVAGL